MKISNVKERKKKRESARERSIGFVMSFARVLDELFIRCLLLLVAVVLVLFRDSLKIRFFFCSIVVGRTTRMKKEDVNRERCRAGDEGRLIFMVMASGGAMTPVMTMTMMGGRCDVIVGRPVVPRGSHSWWSVVDERVEARK